MKLIKRILSNMLIYVFVALLVGGVAFAATGARDIWAEFANIRVVINGNTFVARDVNGTIVEPFIVDGTTYLPVRAISQALGCNVDWNGDTKTVTISSSNTDEWPQTTEEKDVKIRQFMGSYLSPNATTPSVGNVMGGADRYRIREVSYWGYSSVGDCFYVIYDILPLNEDFYENGIHAEKGTIKAVQYEDLKQIDGRSVFVHVEVQNGKPIFHLSDSQGTW